MGQKEIDSQGGTISLDAQKRLGEGNDTAGEVLIPTSMICPICGAIKHTLDVTNHASLTGKKEFLRYCPRWREHPPGA